MKKMREREVVEEEKAEVNENVERVEERGHRLNID